MYMPTIEFSICFLLHSILSNQVGRYSKTNVDSSSTYILSRHKYWSAFLIRRLHFAWSKAKSNNKVQIT